MTKRRQMTSRDITTCVLMRCRGYSYANIADVVGFGRESVRYRLDESFRDYRKQKAKEHKNPEKATERHRQWRRENVERYRQYQRNRKRNKDERSRANRKYNAANREKNAKRHRERLKSDLDYRLRCYLRSRLYNAIKHDSKRGSAIEDLGCSISELRKHIEKQFQVGMTWSNYGEWHIDHIRPLASFNLTSRKEFLQACHYTNLQPLWAEENLQKRDKDPQLHTTSAIKQAV
jgi:hypothetical protein